MIGAAGIGEDPNHVHVLELRTHASVRARGDQRVEDYLGRPVERYVDGHGLHLHFAVVLVVVLGIGLVGVGLVVGVVRVVGFIGIVVGVVGARRIARQLDMRQDDLHRRDAYCAAGASDDDVRERTRLGGT